MEKSILCVYLIISYVLCVEVLEILTLVIFLRFSLLNYNKSLLFMKHHVTFIFRSLLLSLCDLLKNVIIKTEKQTKTP